MALREIDSFDSVVDIEPYTDPLELPEHLRPGEYGLHNYEAVNLGNLIRVHQVRLGINPEIDELKESIQQNDLLNAIDIAVVEREMLQSYLTFVNRIWGSDHNIDDYQSDENGLYYLVIAGHSRVEAITRIEVDRAKQAKAEGYVVDPHSSVIMCKLHRVSDPEGILAIQLAENTYKEPSEERRAIAIVETFRWGLEMGKWHSRAEFLETGGKKFSRTTVDRAMLFAELPLEAQQSVLLGHFKYATSCEMGRVVKPFRNYLLRQKFGVDFQCQKISQEDLGEIDNKVIKHIMDELGIIRDSKLSIRKVKERVRNRITNDYSIKPLQLSDQLKEVPLFGVSQDEQYHRVVRIIDRRFRDRALALASSQTKARAQMLNIAMSLFEPGSQDLEDVRRVAEGSNDIWASTLVEVVPV